MASAASTSFFGAATWISAKAAFMAVSETGPSGRRAAACSCANEALTNELEVVPSATLSVSWDY